MGSSKAEDSLLVVSFPIAIGDEAERDISEASQWYGDRECGLGLEFIGCMDAC